MNRETINCYSSIAPIEKDNMNIETLTELKEPPLPPPIFLTSPINYVNLCNNSKEISRVTIENKRRYTSHPTL